MTNSVNFFDRTFPHQIYDQMIRAGEEQGLVGTLVEMQVSRGMDPVVARQTAQVCIAAVASCEGIRDAVSDDAMAVFDQFLADLKARMGDQQLLFLHKLYFGLTAHEDPDLIAQLEEGLSADDLFWRYYDRQTHRQPPFSAAEMEDRVRQALGRFSLSPQVMKALTRKMESTGAYLATAAALSEQGANYKCIVAMDLYLNHADSMTLHEAANLACAGVQSQAVADAVARGFMTRDLARKILIAAAVAAVVIGVGILLYHAGAAMAAAKTAAAMAEAANASYVLEVPSVFAEFATATTASGAPGMAFTAVGTETVGSWAAALRQKALIGQVIGAVVAASGAVIAVLSDRAATLIGRFSVMLHRDAAVLADGLNDIAGSAVQPQTILEEEQEEAAQEDGMADSLLTVF